MACQRPRVDSSDRPNQHWPMTQLITYHNNPKTKTEYSNIHISVVSSVVVLLVSFECFFRWCIRLPEIFRNRIFFSDKNNAIDNLTCWYTDGVCDEWIDVLLRMSNCRWQRIDLFICLYWIINDNIDLFTSTIRAPRSP